MTRTHASRSGMWSGLACAAALVVSGSMGCGTPPPAAPPKQVVVVDPPKPPDEPPKKAEPTPAEDPPKKGEPTPAEPPKGVDLPEAPKKAEPKKAEPPKKSEPPKREPEGPPPVKLEKLADWKVVQKLDYGKRVGYLAYSPTGELLAAAGAFERGKPTIRLWKTSDWSPAGELAGHTETIASFVFSPIKPQLVSAGGAINRDTEIKVWDLTAKTAIPLQGHGGVVGALAIDSTGGLLATAGDSRVVRLWDLSGKLGPNTRPFELFRGHDDAITCLAFSPDVKFLASTSTDLSVRLWVVAEARQRSVLRGMAQAPTACLFTPNGEQLLAADADGEVRIWDVFTLNELAVIRVANSKIATSLSISNDGKLAAVGLETGEVAIIDLGAKKALGAVNGHLGYVNSVSFSPDGRLATGGEDGQVLIWERSK